MRKTEGGKKKRSLRSRSRQELKKEKNMQLLPNRDGREKGATSGAPTVKEEHNLKIPEKRKGGAEK